LAAAAPLDPPPMTPAEEAAARQRVAEALAVMQAHRIAQRLADADAALAATRAAADAAAAARWDQAAPLPAVEEPPIALPLAEPPAPLAPVEESPAALALAEPPATLPPVEEPPAVLALSAAPPPVTEPPIEEGPGAGVQADPPAIADGLEAPLSLAIALPIPPLPPALAPAKLPPEVAPGGTRAFIHHVARADAARQLAGALPDGIRLAEIRAVRASPAAPDVRYFFAEDRTAAAALAAAMAARHGTAFRVRAMGHFRPLPQPGTLEVWLPQP
jgi:hypothetical protein